MMESHTIHLLSFRAAPLRPKSFHRVFDEACDLSSHPNSTWHHSSICQTEIPVPTVHLMALKVFLLYENTHKKGNDWKSFLKNMCHFIGLDTL